jgi:hypothetical protein
MRDYDREGSPRRVVVIERLRQVPGLGYETVMEDAQDPVVTWLLARTG